MQYVVDSPLGKASDYTDSYNPDCLFAIPREGKRKEIGIENTLPFYGFDCWNHYEVSWLNPKGKPIVAMAEIYYDCATPCIVESKSLKLYFNSFNNTQFDHVDAVESVIIRDLEKRVGGRVWVKMHALKDVPAQFGVMEGLCLDDLDISCNIYTVNPKFLSVKDIFVEETVYSDLLKSNCLVTNQPDWASIQIHYQGYQIDHEGLLQYLISFRNHNEFHEQCIERIFMDITKHCKPEKLIISGRFTRRGGLDINPYRSSEQTIPFGQNIRLIRQ